MEKTIYKRAELDVIEFDTEDVIATSTQDPTEDLEVPPTPLD